MFEPTPTAFDLRWRMFGTPVRVHPSFWIFSAILGWNQAMKPGEDNRLHLDFTLLLVWVACMFVSILVHEFGHILMGLLAGQRGQVVLYSFGGLAIGNWHHTQRWQRIAISAAGPLAGLLFFGLAVGLELLYREYFVEINLRVGDQGSLLISRGILFLIVMNLFWSLINLIPVYPLDGGQISREICTAIVPRTGVWLSLGLSFLIAGLIAVYSVIVLNRKDLPYPPLDPFFNVILFGLLAVQSFQMMQQAERERRRWESDDNPW